MRGGNATGEGGGGGGLSGVIGEDLGPLPQPDLLTKAPAVYVIAGSGGGGGGCAHGGAGGGLTGDLGYSSQTEQTSANSAGGGGGGQTQGGQGGLGNPSSYGAETGYLFTGGIAGTSNTKCRFRWRWFRILWRRWRCL
jgi:hypothetical protein